MCIHCSLSYEIAENQQTKRNQRKVLFHLTDKGMFCYHCASVVFRKFMKSGEISCSINIGNSSSTVIK